jgi:hypothetical protein
MLLRYFSTCANFRLLVQLLNDCRIVITQGKGTRILNISVFQITTVVLMAGATITLLVAIRKYMAAASERRMVTMLERVGLDPAIATSGKPNSVLECVIAASMKEMRQRCRACTTEDICERWLAGDEHGDNDFCPNAKMFDALKVICGADARL